MQGLNQTQTAEKFGEDLVYQWRHSYTVRPPNGESLQDTAVRAIYFFKDRILTHLRNGDNVLVSAHGNSLRSIIMYLESLSASEVPKLELATGVPVLYDIDNAGNASNKFTLD